VTNVAVTPEFQGKGVGKALIDASLERFREKGARYVRIETLQQNAKGLNCYPSLGFKEVGRQVYFFKEL
jgi:ribosomal protein S18 acetylase RimI-like enzyme